MTDLSDWGGGIDRGDAESADDLLEIEPDDGQPADDGRCRALTSDGRRCREGVSVDDAGLCPAHDREPDLITIDDDPAYLIGATAGDIWPNPADEIDGWNEIRKGLHEASSFDWTPTMDSE